MRVASSRARCAASLPLRLVARLALVAQVAARAHDAAQHVVGKLDPAQVEPLLDAQQPAVDERRQRVRRRAHRGESLAHALLGQAFAKARLGEHLVLDEFAHAGRLVGQRPLVEFG